jgi:phenylpyruvate tautomerase PptA (4-oxalocrotonate tautomerase family)
MPILEIEIITRLGESIDPQLATDLADRAGAIFGSPAGHTWVRVHSLPSENYAENHGGSGVDVYPVFVSVLKAERPSPQDLQREVEQLTMAVAQLCNRPEENVHIIYLPDGRGRVAFGGKVVGT